MSERTLIRDIYCVETDEYDWPMGVSPEEKEALVALIKETISRRPLLTYELHNYMRHATDQTPEKYPAFRRAVILDWTYACVVRAARAANCEQRWHKPEN